MLKVCILFSRQWKFTDGFLKEEGHDQTHVWESQLVDRVENHYWKQGEPLGAGAVVRKERIMAWTYAVTVKTQKRGCNWRYLGRRVRENWKFPRYMKWRTSWSRTWTMLVKMFDLLYWSKIQIKTHNTHSYFWVLKLYVKSFHPLE